MTYSVNIVRRIVIHPKGGEILTFQDIGQIRLGVEQIDLCFLETTTLAPVYISGVLAVRTLIVRLQIVSRVAGSKKQRLLFNGERMELPAKLCGSVRIAVDQCPGICDAQMGNLIIDFMNPRNLFIYFVLAAGKQVVRSQTLLLIYPHNGVVLGIRQCHAASPLLNFVKAVSPGRPCCSYALQNC